jgi:integrase
MRDAALRDLIPSSPCILTTPHLPSAEDADSEWRLTASFTRAELEVLISPHALVEPDATVTYALLGLAAVRHGELAALRWRHVLEREPLAGLLVANSNARRRTKKGKTRLMPVHPTLAAVLAEWRLEGWARLMGRAPAEDDLVMPLPLQPASGRRVSGKRPELQVGEDQRRRTHDFTWKRSARHLEQLGLRHRRVHDLRRTFVSLATADGADDRILQWGTHGRPGDIMGAYGDADWTRLCAEVAKLKVTRAKARKVIPLRKA